MRMRSVILAAVMGSLMLTLMFASFASAQEEEDAGGTFLLSKKFDNGLTLRPSITLSLVEINVRNGDFSGGFTLGPGYGLDYKEVVSGDFFTSMKFGEDNRPNTVILAFVIGVMKHLHVGIAWELIEDSESMLKILIGSGLSFVGVNK